MFVSLLLRQIICSHSANAVFSKLHLFVNDTTQNQLCPYATLFLCCFLAKNNQTTRCSDMNFLSCLSAQGLTVKGGVCKICRVIIMCGQHSSSSCLPLSFPPYPLQILCLRYTQSVFHSSCPFHSLSVLQHFSPPVFKGPFQNTQTLYQYFIFG